MVLLITVVLLIFSAPSRSYGESHNSGGSPPGLEVASTEELVAHHEISCDRLQQRKDTDMLCVDGCEMRGDYCWENPHPVGTALTGGHKACYCLRACLAMMASAGGQNLSQDRISYYIFEEAGTASQAAVETGHIGDPFEDLGHDRGIHDPEILLAMNWIYGSTGAFLDDYDSNTFDDGNPSDMDTIREYLDDDRPVIRGSGGHATLIIGYALIRLAGAPASDPADIYLLTRDPYELPAQSEEWVYLDPEPGLFFMFPPPTGRQCVSDEPEVHRDSDGDHIVDFDETRRFHTDPNKSDSDGDGLDDMTDMLATLFNPDGSYNPRERDLDGDGQPKELDPDNDVAENDGVNDGCEDVNRDGFFQTGESDNFNPADEFSVMSPECFRGRVTKRSEYVVTNEELTIERLSYEEIIINADTPLGSDEYAHEFRWNMSTRHEGNRYLMAGADEGTGLARIKIGEDYGRYHLITDVEPRTHDYTITTIIESYQTEKVFTESFMFANNAWTFLGEPVRTADGRLHLVGEQVNEVPGIPSRVTITWDIWL
jgi:hypothetical protein